MKKFLLLSIPLFALCFLLMSTSKRVDYSTYTPIIKDVVITFGGCDNAVITNQNLTDLNLVQPGHPNYLAGSGFKISVQKLLTTAYKFVGNKRYYVEGGLSTTQCLDFDHLTNLNANDPLKSSIVLKGIDTGRQGLVWCQVVSQCHAASGLSGSGNGAWWKEEKWFSTNDFPLSHTDSRGSFKFKFKSVTSCNDVFGKEYGCGTDDLK